MKKDIQKLKMTDNFRNLLQEKHRETIKVVKFQMII